MPQFYEGSARARVSIETSTKIDPAKDRKRHLKEKYDILLKEYKCEDMGDKKLGVEVFKKAGVEVFKLLARKEEEFDAGQNDYRSRLD